MKLKKQVKITVNPYDCNIREITTTWTGFNNRGEYIYHSKTFTAFPEIRYYTVWWYRDPKVCKCSGFFY